jgi:AcrR family transcriptional regulator
MDESIETRDRIKAAARQLFAERGVEAVTVREIVAAAGAKNGGSLNYYFRSKEILIEELISDSFRDATEGWLDRLAVLERAGGARTVRDIVEVLIMGTVNSRSKQPPTAARFIASVFFTRRHMIRDLMKQLNFTVFERLLKQISEIRSDIPAAVMRQRLIFFAWYAISVLSAHEAYVASRKSSSVWSAVDPLLNIIDTAAGLIDAPSHYENMANPQRLPASDAKAPRAKRRGRLGKTGRGTPSRASG